MSGLNQQTNNSEFFTLLSQIKQSNEATQKAKEEKKQDVPYAQRKPFKFKYENKTIEQVSIEDPKYLYDMYMKHLVDSSKFCSYDVKQYVQQNFDDIKDRAEKMAEKKKAETELYKAQIEKQTKIAQEYIEKLNEEKKLAEQNKIQVEKEGKFYITFNTSNKGKLVSDVANDPEQWLELDRYLSQGYKEGSDGYKIYNYLCGDELKNYTGFREKVIQDKNKWFYEVVDKKTQKTKCQQYQQQHAEATDEQIYIHMLESGGKIGMYKYHEMTLDELLHDKYKCNSLGKIQSEIFIRPDDLCPYLKALKEYVSKKVPQETPVGDETIFDGGLYHGCKFKDIVEKDSKNGCKFTKAVLNMKKRSGSYDKFYSYLQGLKIQ